MYNVPGRTGCNILPETAVTLAKNVDNIVGLKAATGNMTQESKTMALAEGCLDMYSGEDGLIVPLMSIGAKGVISVLSNVAPQETHDICAKFMEGNIEEARNLQFKALDLIDALFCEVNPVPVKHALNLMGWDMGPLRMPLCEMEEKNLARLKAAMEAYGINTK
jgi:4-hydroxy-tetrahydrodipicolinate synthase